MKKNEHLKSILLIIGCSFIAALFFTIGRTNVLPAFSAGEVNKALYKGDENVALTFNIGWGDVRAEEILTTLEDLEVKKVTFFLSGSWAEAHPQIVEKIIKKEYEIGVLGFNYIDYTEVETKKIRSDIHQAVTALEKLGVKNIKYLRAPTGDFDKRFLEVSKQLGYTVVHYSINSQDWKSPGTEQIVKNTMKAKAGDIVLLHASDSAKQTAASLPLIINGLKNKNLPLVTISEMFSHSKQTTVEID